VSSTLAHDLWAAAGLLAGFGIVMATLALLWGLTALMSRLVARLERPAPAAAPVAAAPAADTAALDGDELVVVVAATAAVLLHRPHRIVRVLPQRSAWGQQGRRDAHSSHRMS
jgi:Na+-transporting methylmalonyl-CoA/oxaloacetate decarboxylase gamma subunit